MAKQDMLLFLSLFVSSLAKSNHGEGVHYCSDLAEWAGMSDMCPYNADGMAGMDADDQWLVTTYLVPGYHQCDVDIGNEMNEYLKVDYNDSCAKWQDVSGDGCMHCSDLDGRQECKDGYERVFDDDDCHVYHGSDGGPEPPTQWRTTPQPTSWWTTEHDPEWPTSCPRDNPLEWPMSYPRDKPLEWPTPYPTPNATEWPSPYPKPTEWPSPYPTPTEWQPTKWPAPYPTPKPTPKPSEWPKPSDKPTEWPKWKATERYPTRQPTEWAIAIPCLRIPRLKASDKPREWPTPYPTPKRTERPTPHPIPKAGQG